MAMCEALRKTRAARFRRNKEIRLEKQGIYSSHLKKTKALDPFGKGHRFRVDKQDFKDQQEKGIKQPIKHCKICKQAL